MVALVAGGAARYASSVNSIRSAPQSPRRSKSMTPRSRYGYRSLLPYLTPADVNGLAATASKPGRNGLSGIGYAAVLKLRSSVPQSALISLQSVAISTSYRSALRSWMNHFEIALPYAPTSPSATQSKKESALGTSSPGCGVV